MFRVPPRRLSVAVTVAVVLISVALSWLASTVDAHTNDRLLDRQLAQVGTLLGNQAAVAQTELADIGQVALNTHADPGAFARFAGGELKQTGQSLSLWRMTRGQQPQQLAVQGVAPRLPAGGPAALAGLRPDGRLIVLGIVPGTPDRLAYALMPGDPNTDLLVYAESPLPSGRRLPARGTTPFSGLDIALYLGRTTAPGNLLESTAPTPIRGDTRSTTVPFGSATLTIVGSSPTQLAGGLAASLPWIVLGVGCALALAGGATVEYVSRRRAHAEALAAENARLYRQQRGIAGTLQHALLPEVPRVPGLDVAGRYAAGVDELLVGGDWFDVIPRGPGCTVFVVGDVSGSGLPAATTMAALRFAVRAYVAQGDPIEDVLTKLRRLIDVDTDHQFATVLLGEVDTAAGQVRMVSAGHFPPLLVAGGRAEPVECPVAPPVGVPVQQPVPRVAAVPVAGSATLLAFTDGLVERRGEVLDTGLDRLRAAVIAAGSRPLEEMLDDVLEALAVEGRKDDTVLLGMRWAR